MNITELQTKLEIIKNCYGEENIELLDNFNAKVGTKKIDIRYFSSSQYLKELEKAREKTLQRLERIDNQLKRIKIN